MELQAVVKITHIIPALTKGGAERVLVELANQAVAAGHEVTVVAAFPVDPRLNRDSLDPRVEMMFISRSGSPRLRRYAALLPWLIAHRRWLLSQDVVHCHLTFASMAGTMIKWLRRMMGRDRPRIVETFHAVGMPIPKTTRSLFRTLAAGRDGCAFMAEDDYWRDFMASHPRLASSVIPNGITMPATVADAVRRRAAREAIGIPSSAAWVIGTIGRVVAERNPLMVVAAFAEIAALAEGEVHFVIGGEGPMLEEVRAEGERRGLGGRLHLPGLVERPGEVLAAMDLYVSVNVGPITGIAGLEAAAFGVPVVALQALADHCAGPQDWIWSSANPADLGAEGARLLHDEAGRHELAVRQREHVRQHHSSEAMAAAYAALYATAGATGAGVEETGRRPA